MNKYVYSALLLWCVGGFLLSGCRQQYIIMDMVHHNPGGVMTESKFLEPSFLRVNKYGAKVFFLFEAAQFGVNWKEFDSSLFPDTSEAGQWVTEKAKVIHTKYTAAKKEGLQVYCMLDMLVLPSLLVAKHKSELTNEQGKIDISKPYTQFCFRELLKEMFDTFPQLDGLVIRTGETYLHDAPYYVGNHPVQHGMHDHVTLINLLREEVCEKRNKKIFYRTWDMGQFHSIPKYYLSVTDSVKPHSNLYFSIKHTITDFWRSAITDSNMDYNAMDQYWLEESGQYGVPFNPCIGIGKHKQIVEVQCQREYEGKASHPNYIAKGVIDGFEEFRKPDIKRPFCLNQIKDNSLFKGIWTWSRGGGWGGPYITNEFWAELNAYVMSHWANNTSCSEKNLFADFARIKGLPESEIKNFRRLCLLSEEGIIKGQYSMLGDIFVNWTRDDNVTGDFFQKAYFDRMIERGQVNEYLKEKEEAVKIWKEIELIATELHFQSEDLNEFVQVSCTYGRIKYELFCVSWHIMLHGYVAAKAHESFDRKMMDGYIAEFDRLWNEWNELAEQRKGCPSIYKISSAFFGHPVGIKELVAKYR